jgi:hypothetical protein
MHILFNQGYQYYRQNKDNFKPMSRQDIDEWNRIKKAEFDAKQTK